ncbi:ParB/RepB/Spo0J family partition protein [Kistimonas asteriae]|uniref:ParB/RepB/Spo0J family partition protein n=1 Tax=Kistimonas asteriae TaxID=517724 RepID=UPI001BAA1DA7|nr:ParB/RepB/Spo0J family partition protein [Kistimonas asteriae]
MSKFKQAIASKEATAKKTHRPNINLKELIDGTEDNIVLVLDTDQVINKDQVRTEFDDQSIDELGDSMVANGQIQPIVVYPKNEEGVYVIQKGERRWRAATRKGLKIKAIIESQELDAEKLIIGELVENLQRDDLKPIEIANALKKLKDSGMMQKDIAKGISKDTSFVSRHLRLLDMPECVLKLYEEGITKDVVTLNNLRKLHDLNSVRAEGICQSAIEIGITRLQSEQYLREENSKDTVDSAPSEPEDSQTSVDSDKIAHVQFSETNPADDGFIGESDSQGQMLAAVSESEPETEPAAADEVDADSAVSEDSESVEDIAVDPNQVDENAEIENFDESEDSGDLWESDGEISLDQDVMLFADCKPGMFSISVKVKDSEYEGTICLDRKDSDPSFIWVKIKGDKVRMPIEKLLITGTLELGK